MMVMSFSLSCRRLVECVLFIGIHLTNTCCQETCPNEGPHCFTIVTEAKSWVNAEQHCSDLGGEIAVYDVIPSTILEDSGQSALWIRRSEDPTQSTQQFTWLDGTDIWQTNVETSAGSGDSIRNCLGLQYSIQGMRWFSDDCETVRHFLCETEHGRECRLTDIGTDYMGTVSYSRDNTTCEFWKDKSDVVVPDTFTFPDGDKVAAANYCRNPNNDTTGLWCFTVGDGPFQYCQNIQSCVNTNNACQLQENGFPDQAVFCTDGKCFVAIDAGDSGKRSWIDAQHCCNSIGANLATFESQSVINNVYNRLTPYFALQRIAKMWVGGYNRAWDSVTEILGSYYISCSAWTEALHPSLEVTTCSDLKAFVCQKSKPSTTTTTPTTTTTTVTTEASTTLSTTTEMPNTLTNSGSSTTTTTVSTFPSQGATASTDAGGSTNGDISGTTTESTTVTSDNKDDENSNTLIYIAVGVGAGILIIIAIIIAAACACCPTKKKQPPFSLYSQEITPYANSHARETYYNNTVFENNELYDSADNISSHYDVPPNGQPVNDNRSRLSGQTHNISSTRSTNKGTDKAGIVNPLYDEPRDSIYSQPSKKVKSKSLKDKKLAKRTAEEASAPTYAELPDLPPRAYSEIETQTSTYYNY